MLARYLGNLFHLSVFTRHGYSDFQPFVPGATGMARIFIQTSSNRFVRKEIIFPRAVRDTVFITPLPFQEAAPMEHSEQVLCTAGNKQVQDLSSR